VGTGDGRFAYNSARRNPGKLFIGIDANRHPLQKISERTQRKASRGGLPNVLFLQAAVENIPPELEGVASEIYINFPWGSLLRAVAVGDETILRNLRQICSRAALLQIVIGIDVERDRFEIDRLALPSLDVDHFRLVLPTRYVRAGFQLLKTEAPAGASLSELQTSWAKRLEAGRKRSFFRILARAAEVCDLIQRDDK
jgi:16S rRNA (adenine(1408)-N(1))-methyltransferase